MAYTACPRVKGGFLKKPMLMAACAALLITITSESGSAEQRLDEGCSLNAGDRGEPRLFKTTGNPDLDSKNDIEFKLIARQFGVIPSFFLYDDSDGPNAWATPDKFGASADGTIAFGITLLRSEVRKSGTAFNNLSVPAILAHEMAHIVQFKNGTRVLGKLQELQADYLAGWYLGRRSEAMGSGGVGQRPALKTFYSIGDYSFNSPQHHGTPEERGEAVIQGYSNSKMPLDAAFNESLKFIGVTGPRESSHDITFSASELSLALADAMKQRETGFSKYRGRRDPDAPNFWAATMSLPGALECDVYVASQYRGNYNCVMVRSLDRDVILSEYEKLVSALQSGIVRTWRAEHDDSSSPSSIKRVSFKSPTSDNELSVSVEQSTSRVGFKLYVTVPYDNY